MTISERRRALREHPAVRNYTLFCLVSLFLLVLSLADRGLEWWGLIPALIGCSTLLMHYSNGPALVLLSLAGLLGMPSPYSRGTFGDRSHFQTPTLMDVVLCVSTLAYVLGHYRLLSLTKHIFSTDSRRSRTADSRRSADLVGAWEMALLVAVLPMWVGLAVVVWTWMMEDIPSLDMPREVWRVLRLVWAILALLGAIGIVTSYLRRATATPEESLLYLQDQCWRQTRREQGRLNRWLAWARLRAQRKKETL